MKERKQESKYGRRDTGGDPGIGQWTGFWDNMTPKGQFVFLFKYVQFLTCYCFFSAGPTAGPDGAGASALKLTLIYEGEEKQGGVVVEGEGEVGE